MLLRPSKFTNTFSGDVVKAEPYGHYTKHREVCTTSGIMEGTWAPPQRRRTERPPVQVPFSARAPRMGGREVRRGPCEATALVPHGTSNWGREVTLEATRQPRKVTPRVPRLPIGKVDRERGPQQQHQHVLEHKIALDEISEFSANASTACSSSRASSCCAPPRRLLPGSVPGSSASRPASTSTVSHATTPSWRSRSFPPRLQPLEAEARPSASRDSASGASDSGLEARWAAVSKGRSGPGSVAPSLRSEMRYLEQADSEVCGANAMLVESFLNVKRWAAMESLPEPQWSSP